MRFCIGSAIYIVHRERERDREREIDEIDCYIDRTFRSMLDFNTKKLSTLVASSFYRLDTSVPPETNPQGAVATNSSVRHILSRTTALEYREKNSAGHNSERSSAIADKLGDTIVCQCYSCAVVRTARAKARYTLPVSTTHVRGRVHGPWTRESF